MVSHIFLPSLIDPHVRQRLYLSATNTKDCVDVLLFHWTGYHVLVRDSSGQFLDTAGSPDKGFQQDLKNRIKVHTPPPPNHHETPKLPHPIPKNLYNMDLYLHEKMVMYLLSHHYKIAHTKSWRDHTSFFDLKYVLV